MKKISLLHTILTLLLIVALMPSCRKDEEIGGTAVQALSGEWWVEVQEVDRADTTKIIAPFNGSYFKLSTYNTAANIPTEMWIDDNQAYYEFKGKVNVNASGQTFTATAAVNEYYEMTFDVLDGKVVTNGAIATGTKNPTDGISFSVNFSDDLLHTYKFRGYRRTRFAEDDH
jgi:hypothetical protein